MVASRDNPHLHADGAPGDRIRDGLASGFRTLSITV